VKERAMRGPVVTVALAVVAAVVVVSGGADAQRGTRDVRVALSAVAIDGATLAGLHLGWAEDSALALLGRPAWQTSSVLGERALGWEPLPGIQVTVHVEDGKIRGIGIRVTEDDPSVPVRTSRGIALAAPVTVVSERYGDVSDGPFWYSADGVAFNVEERAEQVRSILIFPPGTPRP
jgi:hypothetical protein